MVDRDTHGRTMSGRVIPKRGPPNTIGTGITDSMESPHRSPRTKPKGDRKHHPIMVSLSHTSESHRKQPFSMLNLPSVTHGNMQHMSPPKMRLHTFQCLKDFMPHMSRDQHPDPRHPGDRHTIGQLTPERLTLCRTHHRNGVEPQEYRDGP